LKGRERGERYMVKQFWGSRVRSVMATPGGTGRNGAQRSVDEGRYYWPMAVGGMAPIRSGDLSKKKKRKSIRGDGDYKSQKGHGGRELSWIENKGGFQSASHPLQKTGKTLSWVGGGIVPQNLPVDKTKPNDDHLERGEEVGNVRIGEKLFDLFKKGERASEE